MSVLNRIAHFQNRRDEVPNQELARDLAARRDELGIREIAENLWSKDKNIRSDCIKVLYEVGAIEPGLIAGYADDFVRLLKSRENRMVWGAMTALGALAVTRADTVYTHLAEVLKAMDEGSVITVDNAVVALARTATANAQYNREIFPHLLQHLQTCRPKEVPQHAEKTLPAVNAENKAAFIAALEKRTEDLSGSGLARARKALKAAQAR